MKTVSDIISEIEHRIDTGLLSRKEILEYINDIEAQLAESIFPSFQSIRVGIVNDGVHDVSALISDLGKIVAVYIDGKKLLKKRDAYDLIDGWLVTGGKLLISDPLLESDHMIVVCKAPAEPHSIDDIGTDDNLLIPDPYHDLYVFYALSQIAAKEGDEASYRNYKEDYNSLLSEAISVTTKRQLFPNYTL